MSNKEILNRLKHDFDSARKLSAQMILARTRGLDPVIVVGDRRIHLKTLSSGKRGTLTVQYEPFW